MMLRHIMRLLVLVGAFALPSFAYAQSVAQPVVPGTLSITNCPGGNTPCFVPYSGSAPVPSGAAASTTTNTSSTIATGGTFQTIAAASATRKSIEFMNICSVSGNCNATSDVCYLYFAASGSATTSDVIVVAAGMEYLRSSGSIPSDAMQATCTTTGDKYYLAIQ